MELDNDLENIFRFDYEVKSGGYLICNDCKGYYKLKVNESPADFSRCECGGVLEYRANIENLLKVPQILDIYEDVEINDGMTDYDEYEELQQIVDFLRNKATERKKFLEDLCQRVVSQEELLNEIRYERLNEIKSGHESVWDILDEKNLDSKINGQKEIIGSIIEQENRFLSHIHEKRNKTESVSGEVHPTTLTKISLIIFLIVVLGIVFVFFLN